MKQLYNHFQATFTAIVAQWEIFDSWAHVLKNGVGKPLFAHRYQDLFVIGPSPNQ